MATQAPLWKQYTGNIEIINKHVNKHPNKSLITYFDLDLLLTWHMDEGVQQGRLLVIGL